MSANARSFLRIPQVAPFRIRQSTHFPAVKYRQLGAIMSYLDALSKSSSSFDQLSGSSRSISEAYLSYPSTNMTSHLS